LATLVASRDNNEERKRVISAKKAEVTKIALDNESCLLFLTLSRKPGPKSAKEIIYPRANRQTNTPNQHLNQTSSVFQLTINFFYNKPARCCETNGV